MFHGFLRVSILLLTTTAVALAQQSSGLVGTWSATFQGFPIEMVLNADGSGSFTGEATQWRVQGNKLVLTNEDGSEAYNFRLQGTQLILTGGDLVAPMTFTRTGGGAASTRHPPAEEPAPELKAPAERPTPSAAPTGSSGTTASTRESAKQRRNLTESDLLHLLEGGVDNSRLLDLVAERGVAFTLTPALTSKLRAQGATQELIAAVREAGASGKSPAASPSRRAPAVAGGPRYTHDRWGLSFAIPPTWKVGERAGNLVLGSDTEAGLMVIRFVRKTSLESLSEDYQEGLQEEGLQLMPASQLENFPAGAARGLAGEMAGSANDGSRLRARVIAVLSPYGDAPVVFGLTTEEKYPQLKPRVEALARSMTFTKPQTPPINAAVAGQYIYFYSSSVGGSYSRQELLNLCSNGAFNRGGEIYSSGSAGTAAGQSGSGGQWSAEGDNFRGTLILTFNNGNTARVAYQKAGGDIVLDGKKYARYGDGSCTQRPPF
jgi:hypothetical protein